MEVTRTMAGILERSVSGVGNATTWREDLIMGTTPANGTKQLTKTRHATKSRSPKDTRMDLPKASSSERAAARAVQLEMQMYYPQRWLHRSGVVRQ